MGTVYLWILIWSQILHQSVCFFVKSWYIKNCFSWYKQTTGKLSVTQQWRKRENKQNKALNVQSQFLACFFAVIAWLMLPNLIEMACDRQFNLLRSSLHQWWSSQLGFRQKYPYQGSKFKVVFKSTTMHPLQTELCFGASTEVFILQVIWLNP